jgi:hypothetical protein
VHSFQSFFSSIQASGEDAASASVIGGLDQAVSLTWPEKSGSRILFHLGDAPPHGKNGFPNIPCRDKTLENLFRDIRQKKLNFFFGRINKKSDKMVRIFENYYGAKIDSLDISKAFLISSSVITSFISTISTTCSVASPNSSNLRSYMLGNNEPDWSKIPPLQATMLSFALPTVEEITSFAKIEEKVKKCYLQIAPDPFGFGSHRLIYYGKILNLVKDSSNPEMSFLPVSADAVFKEIVSLPTIPNLDRHRYAINLEIQTIASKIAFEFNDKLSKITPYPNIKIKYLNTKIVRMLLENKEQRFLAYEKRIRLPPRSAPQHRLCAFFPQSSTPEVVKYTNNVGYVINPDTLDADGRKKLELAIAFSHFSYDFTSGYLLVCNLQGSSTSDGKGEPILLLTEPVIHCSEHLPRFGKTNLGALGIKKFFNHHLCNQYCSALGLKMPIIN